MKFFHFCSLTLIYFQSKALAQTVNANAEGRLSVDDFFTKRYGSETFIMTYNFHSLEPRRFSNIYFNRLQACKTFTFTLR